MASDSGCPLPGLSQPEGMTLIELIMVMLIIGLALAVSFPSLSRGTSAFHLRATARDVLNTLRYAREKAITEQQSMRITVNPQEQKVILTDDVGDGARVYTPPHDVKIQQVFLDGEEVRDGPLVIRFMTNGSCPQAQIVLVSDKGGVVRVVTDPISGGARVQIGQKENGQ